MACDNCGSSDSNYRMINVSGNLDVCADLTDLEKEYIGQLACDIVDFQACDFDDMLKILSEVLKNIDCYAQNVNAFLCKLFNRDIKFNDTKTIDFTVDGDWFTGDDIKNVKADVKLSADPLNSVTLKPDGLFAYTGVNKDGYAPVTVTITRTIPWSRFGRVPYSNATGLDQMAIYWTGGSGAGGEDYFIIQKQDMEIFDTIQIQTYVTGNFLCAKTCDVQSVQDMGTYYRINIDTYLIAPNNSFVKSPVKTVTLQAVAFGRKKVQ